MDTTTTTAAALATTTKVRLDSCEGAHYDMAGQVFETVKDFDRFLLTVACSAPEGAYDKVRFTLLTPSGDEITLRIDVQHATCAIVPTVRGHIEKAASFHKGDTARSREYAKTIGAERMAAAREFYSVALAAL